MRWMCDAAGESGYFEALALKLAPYLDAEARVLELGCGTGALALALSPYVKSVTALDASALALSALKEYPANVLPVCADAFSYAPETPFDTMLLCYFSRPDELMQLSRLCHGQALLICDAQRSAAFELFLLDKGIAFEAERFSLPFDQPLRSREEARAYVAYYNRPMAAYTGDARFPYRDAINRNMALLRYDCGGLH